jgi:hypothetical protein
VYAPGFRELLFQAGSREVTLALVGALWGVFLWGEFKTGSASAKGFIAAALVLYALGVATMSIAYTLR